MLLFLRNLKNPFQAGFFTVVFLWIFFFRVRFSVSTLLQQQQWITLLHFLHQKHALSYFLQLQLQSYISHQNSPLFFIRAFSPYVPQVHRHYICAVQLLSKLQNESLPLSLTFSLLTQTYKSDAAVLWFTRVIIPSNVWRSGIQFTWWLKNFLIIIKTLIYIQML